MQLGLSVTFQSYFAGSHRDSGLKIRHKLKSKPSEGREKSPEQIPRASFCQGLATVPAQSTIHVVPTLSMVHRVHVVALFVFH